MLKNLDYYYRDRSSIGFSEGIGIGDRLNHIDQRARIDSPDYFCLQIATTGLYEFKIQIPSKIYFFTF
jgi:hypothetical protein